MKTYKILVHGGVEGLEFPDLIIEKDGASRVVTVRKGECVPVRNIKSDMLAKSLLDGCLSRSMKAGWVIEIEEGQDVPIVEKTDAEKLQEFQKKNAEVAAKVEESANKTPEQMAASYVREQPKVVDIAEGSKVVDNSKPEVKEEVKPEVNPETKIEINEMEHFNKFKHFEKLAFISKSTNKELLKEISIKADSKQIRGNALKKLKNLEAS